MRAARRISDVSDARGARGSRGAPDVGDTWDTSAPGSPEPGSTFVEGVSTALPYVPSIRHDGYPACTDAVGSYALNEAAEGCARRPGNPGAPDGPYVTTATEAMTKARDAWGRVSQQLSLDVEQGR
jgi:hypothetical protein